MNESEIKRAIIEELENLGIIIDPMETDMDFITNGEIDSITFISFIVAMEERFDIIFPDDSISMEGVHSLNGLAALIYELMEDRK